MLRVCLLWLGIWLCLATTGTSFAQSTITGRLLQKQGGALAPVPNCAIFARSIDNGPLVAEYPDGRGRFSLAFPSDERVTLGTICPGYRVLEINGVRTLPPTLDCSSAGLCSEIDLTLEPLGVVDGYVVDHNGTAMENISVELTPTGTLHRHKRQANSDDQGYFRFYHLTPGEYELKPVTRHFSPREPAWEGDAQRLSLEAGETVSAGQVRLRLIEGANLSGRIPGLPPGIMSLHLVLTRNEGNGMQSTFGESVEVDAEGRFEMDGVPPGKYRVQMSVPVNETQDYGNQVYVGSADLEAGSGELVFSRLDPGRVEGAVVVEWPDQEFPGIVAQSPIPFRLVSSNGFEYQLQAGPPDYKFVADNLVPGKYELRFSGPGAKALRRGPDGEWIPIDEIMVRERETTQLELRVVFQLGRLMVQVKPASADEKPAADRPSHHVVGIRRIEDGENDPGVMLLPTDQNGRLIVRYFQDGDYEICAWQAMSPEEAMDPDTWEKAGDAVRKFRHEDGVDMEITLTAAQ